MKIEELFEAIHKAADQTQAFCNWEVPVKVGNDQGAIGIPTIIDTLTAYGTDLDDKFIGVSFEAEDGNVEESYFQISEIEIDGPAKSF